MKIKEFFKELNMLDETSWREPEELLRRRPGSTPFDYSQLSPSLAKEIKEISQLGMSEESVFNMMLACISTATGRYTEIYAPEVSDFIKPNLYFVNIASSASSKTPTAKLIFGQTLFKRNQLLSRKYDEGLDHLEKATKSEFDNTIEKGSKQDTPLSTQEMMRRQSMLNLERKTPVINNYTPEALMQALRNSACLVHFDELSMFWMKNCPKNINDEKDLMPMFTQLYSSYSASVLRIGGGKRDVYDASLSIYAHGTPGYASKFFSQIYLENGTTYRYLFSSTEEKELDVYEKGGVSIRLAQSKPTPSLPITFISIFDKLFDSIFEKEGMGLSYEPTRRNQFKYSPEAIELKKIACNGILDTFVSIYDSAGNRLKKTMILKTYSYIDKLALLFHLIKLNSPENINSSLKLIPNEVQADSVDLAFEYMRGMFNNWLDLIGKNHDDGSMTENIIEINQNSSKTNKGWKYAKDLSERLGGPGVYTREQVFLKLQSITQKNKRTRTYQLLFKEANDFIIPLEKNEKGEAQKYSITL